MGSVTFPFRVGSRLLVSPLLHHAGGQQEVFDVGPLYHSACVFFQLPSFAFSRLHGLAVQRCGSAGFEEPHLRLMFWFVEPGFRRISHISAYAAHQGGLVLCGTPLGGR